MISIILTLLLFSLTDSHIFVSDVSRKLCNEDYLKRSVAMVARKNHFEYYPWHVFELDRKPIKFLQIRGGDVREICKSYLPEDVQEVIFLNINLEYIEPGYFQSDMLEQVFVQGNKLTRIHGGVFNGTMIRSLVLSDNSIQTIDPGAFRNMSKLEAVALDYNSIQNWDSSWFQHARFLHDLSITHNLLTELPEDATQHVSETLETDSLRRYGSVNFDNNRIVYVHPNAFRNLRNFGTVSLSNNMIRELSERVFDRFTFLMSLYMNSNEMSCFNNDTVRSFTGVRRLFLGDNRFGKHCVKELEEFFALKGDSVYF